MDKSWITMDKRSREFAIGLANFLEFSKGSLNKYNKIRCPCVKCLNTTWMTIPEVKGHAYVNGFNKNYTRWIMHGETIEGVSGDCSTSQTYEYHWRGNRMQDMDIDRNIDDAIGSSSSSESDEDVEVESTSDDDDDDINEIDVDILADNINMVNDARDSYMDGHPRQFDTLLKDAETPLYPGCRKFTKLSALVKLYNLKSRYGLSDVGFTDLLKLLGEMLPLGHALPDSLYTMKKSLSKLGMGYEKIHCCPKNCILYRKEFESFQVCPRCGKSRWKLDANDQPRASVPAKVMWYIPPIPRFVRMFRNSEIAKHLTWHATEREISDGKLRHPADSPQWKLLDSKWPIFGEDSRNLRLGLSADGINPHKHMSSTHSTWPVLMVVYNLPPWMCMKRKFIMMTALISGPKQPGDAIDVFLQPLIDDLKLLWNEGVRVWDEHKREFFTMRAALLWTINDFPAYGNLSGHKVHGYLACPICSANTHSEGLKHSFKPSFCGHRKWLPSDHPFRMQQAAFNGHKEFGEAPMPKSGREIFRTLSSMVFNPKDTTQCWKKVSIFWELEYWKFLFVRHNLDVMHIEKNVCDSIVGTLLMIPGKTKDTVNARLDMKHLGLRLKLAPGVNQKNGKTFLPAACHTLNKEEKEIVIQCLAGLKVPEGYSSNFQNIACTQTKRLKNMKSHDLHMLMQQFLPVAIRSVLPEHVRVAVMRMCSFFNEVCKKEIDVDHLEHIQREIVVTLCLFEQYFPPAFFDIMVHLTVHLTREITLCGPVHYRWMYPFERYMKVLKGYVRNHTYPEGCIIENYIAEEAIEFCTEYQKGISAIGNPLGRYDLHRRPSNDPEQHMKGGVIEQVTQVELHQVHTYILNNSPKVEPYFEKHMYILRNDPQNRSRRGRWFQDEHNRSFASWLKNEVSSQWTRGHRANISETLRSLACGPQFEVIKYQSYDINGFSFHTFDRDKRRKTQNFGVTLVAQQVEYSTGTGVSHDHSFYGVITEIWDIRYSAFRIPVFKCDWVNNRTGVKQDHMGFTLVNLQNIGHFDDQFILASQARQVFYARDPTVENWLVVLHPTKYKTHMGDDDANELIDDSLTIANPFVAHMPQLSSTVCVTDTDILCARDDCDGTWV